MILISLRATKYCKVNDVGLSSITRCYGHASGAATSNLDFRRTASSSLRFDFERWEVCGVHRSILWNATASAERWDWKCGKRRALSVVPITLRSTDRQLTVCKWPDQSGSVMSTQWYNCVSLCGFRTVELCYYFMFIARFINYISFRNALSFLSGQPWQDLIINLKANDTNNMC